MSRATDQATALLIFSWGALKLIGLEGHSDSSIDHTVEYALDLNERAINDYPRTGDEAKMKRWIKECNQEWNGQGDSMATWSPCVLATMASNICEDLLAKVRNPAVRAQIEALRDATVQISYHYAEKTEQEHAHFAEADLMLSQYYDIINFER